MIAVDRMWPLVDAVTNLLVHGDPIDYDEVLTPHLEKWEDSWMDAIQADATTSSYP